MVVGMAMVVMLEKDWGGGGIVHMYILRPDV